MISKLRATGGAGFDLATVQTRLFIPSMLEATKKNTTLGGQVYGLPHIWGTDALILDTKAAGDALLSLVRSSEVVLAMGWDSGGWTLAQESPDIVFRLWFTQQVYDQFIVRLNWEQGAAPRGAPPRPGAPARHGDLPAGGPLGGAPVGRRRHDQRVPVRAGDLPVEAATGVEVESLRSGLVLVVLGQFSFITTLTTLVLTARLRKFDRGLEEAARTFGATRAEAIVTVTLRFLRPAAVAAAALAFLMSFEDFDTTLFLVGSDATLPITMFVSLRDGSTPVIDAVSLVLMVASATIGLLGLAGGSWRRRP